MESVGGRWGYRFGLGWWRWWNKVKKKRERKCEL